MTYPVISIITIVFNGEKHLEQTISSVLNQNYPNIEYIIIDGGSTDNTVDIIKKYENRLAYWISEKDNGVSDAFNKGLRQASGKFVGIINADDWYADNAFITAASYFDEYDVVYGDMQMWKNEKTEYIVQGNHSLMELEMSVNHPTVFVRRSCYETVGGFKSYKCAMDYEMVLRLKLNSYRFVRVPRVLANMRWDGISDSKWLLGCKETLQIKNSLLPGKSLQHKIYYYKHIAAIGLPKILKKMGLNSLVRFYRSRFASLKKNYS